MSNDERNGMTKICTSCDKNQTCPRSSGMARKCYQAWYNRNKRDAGAEKLRQALYRHQNFANWMLSRCKSQAKKAGLDFDLDLVWFQRELRRGCCAVTGIDFVTPSYDPRARGQRGPWTPSVDRIDNSKGYTKENCRLVIWIYNLAKSNYAESDVVRMCNAVTNNSRVVKSVSHGVVAIPSVAIRRMHISATPRCGGWINEITSQVSHETA